MCVQQQGGERRAPVSPSRPTWRRLVVPCVLLLLLAAVTVHLTLTPRQEVDGQLEVAVYGHEVEVAESPMFKGQRPGIPSIMMDLFHRGPHGQLTAEIVRSLTPRTIDQVQQKHREAAAGSGHEHLHLLTFDLPALFPGETLHSAQLRLTFTFLDQGRRPARGVEGMVRVYWESAEASLSQPVHDHALEMRVTFNCTDLIDRFHRLQKSHGGELQLMVGVTLSPEVNIYPLVAGDTVDQQPLLLLLYTPSQPPQAVQNTPTSDVVTMRKRDLEAEDYEEESNQLWPVVATLNSPSKIKGKRTKSYCRRRPLYVEFSDINYDTWIVAPTGYQAYQCAGRCPYPLSDHLSPTKHAIIQTLLHSLHPATVSRSCCVPTRLDSISILYMDSQGVLTYRLSYKDMVVADCGCR